MRRGAGRLARILRVTFLRPSVWFRSVRARAAVPSLVAALQRRGLRRSTRRALRAMDALWTRVSPPRSGPGARVESCRRPRCSVQPISSR